MKMARVERLDYQKKRDSAIMDSSQYYSIILDGADPTAFGLLHFCTVPKTQRGHALIVRLIGLFEHYMHIKLHLLQWQRTMQLVLFISPKRFTGS